MDVVVLEALATLVSLKIEDNAESKVDAKPVTVDENMLVIDVKAEDK